MLIAVGVVVGIILLSRKAEQIAQPSATSEPGQYPPTGMAATATHNFGMPDGSPTFTPSKQKSAVSLTVPFSFSALGQADPSVAVVRGTYTNLKPTKGINVMTRIQDAWNKGY